MKYTSRSILNKYLRPYTWTLIVLFFLIVVNSAIGIINPRMIGAFINSALEGASTRHLLWIAIVYI